MSDEENYSPTSAFRSGLTTGTKCHTSTHILLASRGKNEMSFLTENVI